MYGSRYMAQHVSSSVSHSLIAFDSPSITLGEVLDRMIALYPRARPYLLDEVGMLPSYMRVLINEVRPDPDATPATLLHDQDRVALLVAIAGGERSDLAVDEVGTIRAHLRLEQSKNKQEKNVHWARDYEL